MATEADLIQKFKDLNIPVGADFEELIHEAFIGANLVDKVDNHDSRIATVENNLSATKGSIQSNANAIEKNANAIKNNTSNITTKADDSKVVHLSGSEEISGQKTFDVAPIDKTTGNPYITKDGVPAVPSTIADTTKLSNFTAGLQKSGTDVATKTDVTTTVSTATANMVDSSKPTNFTAGLKSGGVDVATAADIKSVEDASWRPLKLVSSTSGAILFKDNGDGTASLTGSAIFNVAVGKDNFVAEVDAPDGYVFTSVDWKINIGSSTQIIGIISQNANFSEEMNNTQQALKVRIQDGNLLIGGSNNWNLNNLITFNAYATNLKTVSLAGSPATIGITKLN